LFYPSNDKLTMSGIQVWDHVLKWRLAQNPELSSDHSSLYIYCFTKC
ncbi:15365_t:CDS:1, partial [Funneliformis caledonium]